MNAPLREQALPNGTTLDTFVIQSVIGTGGFGITYRAYDHTLDRPVAIKEYFPSGLAVRAANDTTLGPRTVGESDAFDYGLRRFLDEARTLAKFNERNIVRVSRFLEAHGTAYFVMDFEDGRSLAQVLEQLKSLNERQVTAIAVHILRGLRAVHDKRFLHRDVKPGNVFIRRSGPPLLLDFGAARMALEQQRGGMTVMLTPGYAPVEQYSRDDNQGPWSDIYGLGATLYHCMTGMPPRPATERITAHTLPGRPAVDQALEDLRGRYSDDIINAVSWMMRPHASERPQSAAEVLEYLLPGGQTRRSPTTGSSTSGNTIPGLVTQQHGPHGASSAGGGPPGTRYDAGPGATAAAPPADFTPDEALIEALVARLAESVGPIASVLVKRAAKRAASKEAFLEALAGELDDDDDRKSFLKSFR